MAESLDVIALISGGKDSFFSLLHCLQNGHKVVALGNLYPAPVSSKHGAENAANHEESELEEEHDLNSFMYQTVGHTVIPLYEEALGIPLYRQQISGTAVQTGTSYGNPDIVSAEEFALPVGQESRPQAYLVEEEDETESLVPLLRRIMAEHPSANAVSTGAILSTYQRTRVESVALRLGLTPLSYLWKYPILPPDIQTSLLEDMMGVGLEARIVKVASGGLDESFLWQNVASKPVTRRIERSMRKFGTDGDGAVLGEGGEFETLVVNGPASLFKGRIEIQEKDRKVVREGGGSAWLKIRQAKVVMKSPNVLAKKRCRIPDILEPRFRNALNTLNNNIQVACSAEQKSQSSTLARRSNLVLMKLSTPKAEQCHTIHWAFSAEGMTPFSITDETGKLIDSIRQRLYQSSLKPTDIVSSIIILRSMQDFASVNKVYSTLFTHPNPPSRVTISCGDALPKDINIAIYLKVHSPPKSLPTRKALHVQSRSYWAPANIGPYSQAISIPLLSDTPIWTATIAGQIPLIPHSMTLPAPDPTSPNNLPLSDFKLQAILALQHLWRIGIEMDVSWWTSAVAYLPRGPTGSISKKAALASQAWEMMHSLDTEDDDEDENSETRDLWEEKHHAGMEIRGGNSAKKKLPDWEIVNGERNIPPFWAVEVEELPRGSGIEWHAHLGVVAGPVKVYSFASEHGWTVHQCSFGYTVHTAISVVYSESVSEFKERLGEALEAFSLDLESGDFSFASYLDVSIEGLLESGDYTGAIPCRSIWANSGERLAAALLLETQ